MVSLNAFCIRISDLAEKIHKNHIQPDGSLLAIHLRRLGSRRSAHSNLCSQKELENHLFQMSECKRFSKAWSSCPHHITLRDPSSPCPILFFFKPQAQSKDFSTQTQREGCLERHNIVSAAIIQTLYSSQEPCRTLQGEGEKIVKSYAIKKQSNSGMHL